ncbi:MAG: hypothetical protein AABX53_00375 [Nanoarchaeota archaeon]
MKIDPYNNKERYLAWQQSTTKGIPNISSQNSEIILHYLEDMERGLNVAIGSPKGGRSYHRLNSLKERMIFFARQFAERHGTIKLTEITEDQMLNFFFDMRKGIVKKQDGGTYKSVDTYARIFRAFWHWHQKTSKKQGIEISDITTDLDTSEEKPDWVYLTEKQVKTLAESVKFDHKVLIMFLFDSGIRAPTELINVKVSDLHNNCKELNIRQEVSKTFGRRIKLLICSELLKEYIENNALRPDDTLFDISPPVFNRFLKRAGLKLFGDKPSPAGQNYSELTMYDFRHCSCCYWLPRYKSESALKYRFGWKKSEKIHYYSELLGMKDTISEEDLLIDTTKIEIEQRLERSEKEKAIMQDRIKTMELQMVNIMELVKQLEMAHK